MLSLGNTGLLAINSGLHANKKFERSGLLKVNSLLMQLFAIHLQGFNLYSLYFFFY